MADNYTLYTTLEGERWDQIAYKAYGNAMLVAPIISANPGILIEDKMPAGVKLLVPIIDQSEAPVPTQELPPWKR